jgi:hypothetical protein
VLGGATAARALRRDPVNRPAALGLVAVILGVCAVAVAVALVRAPAGLDRGLQARDSLLAWPLSAAVFLAWVKWGGKWLPAGLCLAAALAFPGNTGTGVFTANQLRDGYGRVEADARAGRPAEALVIPPIAQSAPRADLLLPVRMLRDAGVGVFAPGGSDSDAGLWRALAGLVTLVLLPVGMVWVWGLCRAVMAERARELFRLQHERFGELVVKAAAASGYPRGLRWVACRVTGEALLTRDAETGGIVALAPVVVEFEPEAGTDMAENPAAREPRPATAVFTFHRGTWETGGRVVFNHTPEQALAAFAPRFRVIDVGGH